MKRNLLAGIGLAGAITVFAGVSAFAEPDEAEPGAALLEQAEQQADAAGMTVATCAKLQFLTVSTAPQQGTSADAWDQAVEQAEFKIVSRAETAGNQIEAAVDTFDASVEAAADAGTTLPTTTTLQSDLTTIATTACSDIQAIQPVLPTPGVTPPKSNEDEQGDVESSEHSKGDKGDKAGKAEKPEKPDTESHDGSSD